MKLHLAGDKKIDPAAFEKETLAALGMPHELVMRHRTPQFGHIFASDDYSAGYYSYLWSDVLTADAYEAFTEAGGPYDKKVAADWSNTSSRSATPSIRPKHTVISRTRSGHGRIDEKAWVPGDQEVTVTPRLLHKLLPALAGG